MNVVNRRRLLTFLAGLMIVAVPVSAALAVPSSFVRHENRYWTWYAPQRWVASYNRNGIDITSPTGTKLAGTAYSTLAQCPSNTASFFRQVRTLLKQQGALYSKPLRSARYTSVGPVRNAGGGDKTQHSTFRGTRRTGAGIRGELDLRLIRQGGCAVVGQVSSAPSRGYRNSIGLLRQIQRAVFYHPS